MQFLNLKNPSTICLFLMASSHTVGTVNIVSVLALAPVISREFELSATQFGFFVTCYYGAQAFWSLPSGGLTDRYGVARVLIVSHVVMASSAIALALAPNYLSCLTAMFLMGVGYAMTNPSTSRGVLDWFPPGQRGLAMGLKQVGVPIGGIIAAGNGAIAEWYNWHSIMLFVALLIFLNGLLTANLLRFENKNSPFRAANAYKGILQVIKDKNVNIFVWSNGFLNFGQTNFFSFLALFLTEVALASQSLAGIALGCVHAVSALARIAWGNLSDSAFSGRRSKLLTWLCLAAVIFLSGLSIVGPGMSMWTIGLLSIVGLGMTIASYAPVGQAIGVEMVTPRLAGSAMGFNMVGIHVGGMIGPIVFGIIVDWAGNYQISWLTTAATVAVGTALIALYFKEGEKLVQK